MKMHLHSHRILIFFKNIVTETTAMFCFGYLKKKKKIHKFEHLHDSQHFPPSFSTV